MNEMSMFESGLGGCTVLVKRKDVKDDPFIKGVAMALVAETCGHTHHIAVTDKGILMSPNALQCLRDQGVSI